MQTEIHSSDFELTTSLTTFIRRQTDRSMGAYADRIERIVVRLKDLNGPKGGRDKECFVEIKMANRAPIVVSKRSANAYASIKKALRRASRTTLRKLGKRRSEKVTVRQGFDLQYVHLNDEFNLQKRS